MLINKITNLTGLVTLLISFPSTYWTSSLDMFASLTLSWLSFFVSVGLVFPKFSGVIGSYETGLPWVLFLWGSSGFIRLDLVALSLFTSSHFSLAIFTPSWLYLQRYQSRVVAMVVQPISGRLWFDGECLGCLTLDQWLLLVKFAVQFN